MTADYSTTEAAEWLLALTAAELQRLGALVWPGIALGDAGPASLKLKQLIDRALALQPGSS